MDQRQELRTEASQPLNCGLTQLTLPDLEEATGAAVSKIDPKEIKLVYDPEVERMYLDLRPQLEVSDSFFLGDASREGGEDVEGQEIGAVDFAADGQVVGIEFFQTQEVGYLYGVMDGLGVAEHYQHAMEQWHALDIPETQEGEGFVNVALLAPAILPPSSWMERTGNRS